MDIITVHEDELVGIPLQVLYCGTNKQTLKRLQWFLLEKKRPFLIGVYVVNDESVCIIRIRRRTNG